ncbi:MAG TPA: ribonuclease H-like domain-containing protein [Lacibacter sp.]|nr:ribonuclease H-like domain-containing protein [Lacibacter sp.]HMP86777.1 ribonuclease H-like domain-containing protein [Lacibacter sp.]
MPENSDPAEMYEQRAGIHAEFGRIICISTGFFYTDAGGRRCFRLRSCNHPDEKTLLADFIGQADAFRKKNPRFSFAGHNIREFDIPFICRRLLINQLPLPDFLDFSGKKPWEVNLVDTLQRWKFGDHKNYSSLQLLAHALGIETPKADMDGSMVKDVYYKEKDLERITAYCERDVVAVAQVLLRFLHLPLMPAANIFVAPKS